MTTKFTALTNSQWAGKIRSLSKKQGDYVQTVSDLIEQTIYSALVHNDSRKADQVFAHLDALHAKQFAGVVIHFARLARITKADRKKSEAEGKPISEDRQFKVTEAGKAKTTGSPEAIERAEGTIEAFRANNWLTWKKPSQPAQANANAVDFAKVFGTFLGRIKESTPESKPQLDAFNSFTRFIQAGQTMDAVRAEITASVKANLEKKIRAEIMAELMIETETKTEAAPVKKAA